MDHIKANFDSAIDITKFISVFGDLFNIIKEQQLKIDELSNKVSSDATRFDEIDIKINEIRDNIYGNGDGKDILKKDISPYKAFESSNVVNLSASVAEAELKEKIRAFLPELLHSHTNHDKFVSKTPSIENLKLTIATRNSVVPFSNRSEESSIVLEESDVDDNSSYNEKIIQTKTKFSQSRNASLSKSKSPVHKSSSSRRKSSVNMENKSVNSTFVLLQPENLHDYNVLSSGSTNDYKALKVLISTDASDLLLNNDNNDDNNINNDETIQNFHNESKDITHKQQQQQQQEKLKKYDEVTIVNSKPRQTFIRVETRKMNAKRLLKVDQEKRMKICKELKKRGLFIKVSKKMLESF